MKKFLSLVLALAMTLSLVTISAGAKDFTDSDELSGVVYEEAVNVMSEMEIIDGYADGDFRPQGTLTRGAAAKIIACMMLGKTTAEALGTQAAPFKDVPVGSTFAGYIAYCVEAGLIDGYADGTFRPQGTLTGFAFLKMLLTALGYDSSIEGYTGTNWTVNVASRATQIGLTDGNGGIDGGLERQRAALVAGTELHAVGRGVLQQAVVARNVALLGFPLVLSHEIETLRPRVDAAEKKLHPLGPPRGRIGCRGKKEEVGIARELHFGYAAHRGAEQQGVLVAHARSLLKRVPIGRGKTGREAAPLHREGVFVVPVVAHGVRRGQVQAAVGGQLAVGIPSVPLERIRRGEPSAVLPPEIIAVVASQARIHRLVVTEKEASDADVPIVGRISEVCAGRPSPQIAAPRGFAQGTVQTVGFQ